jgi:hypothetical protein
MDRYRNFTLAARQAFPAGTPVEAVEAAISQHEELHTCVSLISTLKRPRRCLVKKRESTAN